MGHSLPRLPGLAPPDVRYASISDQNFAAPRLVAMARSGLAHCSKLGRDSRGETQLTYASASTTGSIELVANRRPKCISLQILDQSLVARSPWPLVFTTSPESPVNCPKEAEKVVVRHPGQGVK